MSESKLTKEQIDQIEEKRKEALARRKELAEQSKVRKSFIATNLIALNVCVSIFGKSPCVRISPRRHVKKHQLSIRSVCGICLAKMTIQMEFDVISS